jgi:hypothetical protein
MGEETPLSVASASAALEEACEEAGLSPWGARLLRFGSHALYVLPAAGVVVRVGRHAEERAVAEREVRVARWLAAVGFPAVRVAGVDDQPLVVGGRPVTVWELVGPSPARPSFADLGRLLRRLHAMAPPSLELPEFDPFPKLRRQIDAAPDLRDADRRFLHDRCDEVQRDYHGLAFVLPPGVIHGDAHRGNLLCQDGEAVLLDFEEFAVGPREWDLVPTPTTVARFGFDAGEYRRFADAYGFDVLAWPGAGVLRGLRELSMTTWLGQNTRESREVAAEFAVRIGTLRTGDSRRRWHAF